MINNKNKKNISLEKTSIKDFSKKNINREGTQRASEENICRAKFIKTVKREIVKDIAIVVLGLAIFLVFCSFYHHAMPNAKLIAEQMENRNGDLYFTTNSEKGVIIYPGAKVDEAAYAPLAKAIYERGYNVVIARMQFKFAILSGYRAAQIMEQNPQIKEWSIAGHSMGATAACTYAFFNYTPALKGIVFLGAYPYKDLSGIDMFALSVRGEYDRLLSRSTPFFPSEYYPENTHFEDISNGNHVNFADYMKLSDGKADCISIDQQVRATAEAIDKAMGGAHTSS